MKPIHKRRGRWEGVAFTTLEDAAEFIAALADLLADAGTELELSVRVSTDDCDYPSLTVAELQELSPALPLESVGTLSMESGLRTDQPVQAELFINAFNGTDLVEFKASGENQVAVDGINVWAVKEIEGRIERIQKARELAEVKSDPHADEVEAQAVEGRSGWRAFFGHPLAVQIIGGTIAAIIAGLILYLLISY